MTCLPGKDVKAQKKSFQGELEELGPPGESKDGILDIPKGLIHLNKKSKSGYYINKGHLREKLLQQT